MKLTIGPVPVKAEETIDGEVKVASAEMIVIVEQDAEGLRISATTADGRTFVIG